MPDNRKRIDKIFYALSDPTRRSIIQTLAKGPASVSAIAKPYDMTLPSLLQHLQILEESALIKSKKIGRVRTCEICPNKLKTAEKWLFDQRVRAENSG